MADKISYEQIEEKFTNYLCKKKQRKTPERYALLDYIYNNEGYFSAEQIHAALQETYRVSLTTVYNTLNMLIDCNLVIRHNFDKQKAFFERAFYETPHSYFVCCKCGAVKAFTDKQIRMSIKQKNFTNFKPSHWLLYIYGECKKCKKK